jgi:hypothetical protein
MSTLLNRTKSAQLPLFSRLRRVPAGRELPADVQHKTVRLLTQLLRQHGARGRERSPGAEGHNE